MAERFLFGDHVFAHRGLWSPEGPAENSLSAFRAAAAAGVGAELDVRLSADGALFVFHDPVLDRMTDGGGVFPMTPSKEISALRLVGSDEPPPTLEAVLEIWPHELPLLVELKTAGDADRLGRAVGAMLDAFPGKAAAMSFDLAALEALAAPRLAAGVLIPPSGLAGDDELRARATRVKQDRFDFSAPHISDLPRAGGDFIDVFSDAPPIAVWTVDAPDKLETAKRFADSIIFEHLDPSLVLA